MIKKVEHVALMATNMDESIAFYTEKFGFEVRDRGETAVRELTFLSHKNQPGFEIELVRDLNPGKEYSASGIVNHLAFTVENMEEAIAYYKNLGITFQSDEPNKSIDGSKIIFFYGPNNELLQLVQPVNRGGN
ncbi:VOC family protein [Evansella sp. AB-P1]|uniref:VOC family protein n=1 Tax=Evansella sp. AB-P1 TaxID=3037653 RepID=UPI00241DE2F7|nr:VOC family protein [Evansella sp. AB-P1]MDG5787190.1 VOC family protein [Evansella sp. AB-P1]